MKKILLGIALILFGFNCFYVSAQAGWAGMDVLGICISVLGIVISVVGAVVKDK